MATPRLTYCSVTNFLCVGDEFLFIHRGAHTKVDAGRLNGIGGKLEAGENPIQAAIRETSEETGFTPSLDQVRFCGLGRLEGGYEQDWVVSFFRIELDKKILPNNTSNQEGILRWIHKDDLLQSSYTLVDDLRYVFPLIADRAQPPFFFSATMTPTETVEHIELTQLSCYTTSSPLPKAGA